MDEDPDWDSDTDTLTVDDYYSSLEQIYFFHFSGTGEVDGDHLLRVYWKRSVYALKLAKHEERCLNNGTCNVAYRYRRKLKILDQFLFYYSFQ
jgi:hypothetical protein